MQSNSPEDGRVEAPEVLSRIDRHRAEALVDADSKRYRELALSLGANAAEVVSVDSIRIDDRVLLKCRVPRCSSYGVCANCPPHSPSPDETRRFLGRYRLAVVLRVPVDPEVIVAGEGRKNDLRIIRRTLYKITSAIESAAFYDGHYFACAFASGSCKTLFCPGQDCAVLRGEKCRQSLRVRPAMEAVGIDCFALSNDLGWEIYPIGKSAPSASIPASFLMGLILIG